jgi:hypothetical protein
MDERERALIKKHSRTPEQIAEEMKKLEAAKQGMTQNVTELEANLREFNEILDPIVNPNTGKPMCWIRRPSQTEWETMIPAELMKYRDDKDVPPEISKKYSDHQFEMMAKLIAKPQHDAQYWKDNSNILFQELFQIHLTEVYRKLGIMVENF